MTWLTVELLPFIAATDKKKGSEEIATDLPALEVRLRHQANTLEMEFHITRNFGKVEWPQIDDHPNRKDELWLNTCFELFTLLPGTTSGSTYREWNFSPDYNWQAYDFESYRYPSPPCPTVLNEAQSPTLKREGEKLNVSLSMPNFSSEVLINTTAMIKLRDGRCLAYALNHPEEAADFHHPKYFFNLKSP